MGAVNAAASASRFRWTIKGARGMDTTSRLPEATFRIDERRHTANGHRRSPNGSNGSSDQLTRALGMFSLGLGLAQLFAPRRVAAMIGLESDGGNAMRLIGLRELASGVGIITQANPSAWLWLRLGGNLIDLALLNSAAASPRADRDRIAVARAAVLGVAALDAVAGARAAGDQETLPAGSAQTGEAQIKAAVTVNAPIAEVYSLWESFRNLPSFMRGLAAVELTGERTSRWTMAGPAGFSVSFDAEITDATRNERIAWRTIESSIVAGSGDIRFREAPGNRGTQVIYQARFSLPGGALGEKIAELFGPALSMKMQGDLLRCKQLLELGEIVQSDDSVVPGPNPAQPVPFDHAQAA